MKSTTEVKMLKSTKYLLLVAAIVATSLAAASPGRAGGPPVDCAELGNVVDGVLDANLRITTHGAICTITGTVKGNVTVVDDTADCATRPPFTAANVVGGTIEGNVKAAGGLCAMVWLREGAEVHGNVVYRARGNLGFLDAPGATEQEGSTVHGNVILRGGLLWATSSATDNRVGGHIICNGGAPRGPSGVGELGSGSETDWDGFQNDVDGTIGGHYLGC